MDDDMQPFCSVRRPKVMADFVRDKSRNPVNATLYERSTRPMKLCVPLFTPPDFGFRYCGNPSLGDGLELLVALRHGPPPCRLDPLPHGLRTDRPRAIPPQQHRRHRKRHKDGQRTAQILELITGPLIRASTQCCIQWGHRWGRTSLGAPAHPPSPTDRSKQAHNLTLDEAFTP